MSDRIGAATLEALVEDAFRVWSEVPCAGGSTPVLSAASQGPIACDQVEFDCNTPDANSNLIMCRDDFVDGPGLHRGVIALTTLTANLRTGELFDADIEINTRDEDFDLEEGGGLESRAPRNLRGVIYHELGHLLGLSHSLENGALMRAAYEGTLMPAPDDIQGICAALSTGRDDPVCDAVELGADAGCLGADLDCATHSRNVTGERDGCACALVGADTSASSSPSSRASRAALTWSAGALLLALRRARRLVWESQRRLKR